MNQRLTALPEPSVHHIGELVRPLSRIPDQYRKFDMDGAMAQKDLGLGPRIQQMLLDAGISSVGTGDDLLFDNGDLHSVSLYIGLRSARRDVMHFWLRSLRRARSNPTAYRISVQTSCPVPRHDGECGYTVNPVIRPDGFLTTSERRAAEIARVHIPTGAPPRILEPDLAALIAPFRDVDFYFLPTFLVLDSTFVRENRIGECGSVARAVVEDASEHGYAARLAHGFIVSAPFSSPHTWAEVEVAGDWVPLDPLLPKALAAWGIARPGDWPVELSPLGLYHRITDEPARWACHDDIPVGVWLPTEVAK